MPWTNSDYPPAFKNLSQEDRERAIKIANAILQDCLERGGKDEECAGKAIRIALAAIKEETMNEKTDNLLETEWTVAYINDLPDSAFAVIEPAYLRGDTEDKQCRHLPFKNRNGKIDLPHYRNALARANQIQPVTDSITTEELRRRALAELNKHRDLLKTETAEESISEAFSWTIPLSEAQIEGSEERGVRAHVTLIRPGWSENGRYYSREVLARAASLFERVGSFDGHIKEPKVTDYVGWFEDVGLESNGLAAKFNIFDDKLGKIAIRAPHLIQLSINGAGRVRKGEAEGKEGWLVEEIEKARSVDVVVNAAAGGGINAVLEAAQEEKNMNITTLDELKAAYPQLLAEAVKAQTDAQTALQKENEEFKKKIAIFETKAILEEELGKCDLPDAAKARIRDLFAAEPAHAEMVKKAIDTEKAYLEKLKEAMPIKGVKKEKDPLEEEHKVAVTRLRKLFGLEEEK